jgi:hydroxymethylpyrimidine kinase/phosphomethylpyrimidine kinase
MLASADTVDVVADAFRRHKVTTSVVDPVRLPYHQQLTALISYQVMVSTSGSALLPTAAISTLIGSLLPLTTILTPNLPEAELLLKIAGKTLRSPENVEDIIKIAKAIKELGPKNVLVKGGHLPMTKGRLVPNGEAEKHVILNVLVSDGGKVTIMETAYLNSRNTHGTGCSLACGS